MTHPLLNAFQEAKQLQFFKTLAFNLPEIFKHFEDNFPD